MRITGGDMRGRVLKAKVGPGVRPTASRVREALFSILGQDLGGRDFLDGFGGSGLITFEAISRGATVTTVERNRNIASGIQASAAQLSVNIDLRVGDLRSILASREWHIIFLDPPYDDDPVEWVAEASTATSDVLVIEHRSGASMPHSVASLALQTTRRYGDSSLTVYRRRSDAGLDKTDVVA
jgi:16S rRNA (guanine(966)-N(2))-methyltransferase RsmD